MSIADELQLLTNTKEQIRLAVGASKAVPFSTYVDLIDGNPAPQLTVDPSLIGIERQTAILANTKESLRVAIGLSTSIPFSQYAGYLMGWNPSELFKNGEQGAWYDPSDMTTLFQDGAGAIPVIAIGDPVGHITDKSGRNNHATQTTSAYRPTYTLDTSGAAVLLGDGVDDALLTPPTTFSGSAYINTSYGWYKSFASEGAPIGLPLTWLKEYVAREGVASVADDDKLLDYFATEQKFMIVMTRNLVVNNLRMFSGGSETTITAIGNNGVTTEKVLSADSNSNWDLSADGLTTPALLVFGNNTELSYFNYYANQFTGSIPDLDSNASLTIFSCIQNRLTGSIPDLSNNKALTNFYCYLNRLTGSIPDLSSNTELRYFYCYTNQLTGSIPDLSSNKALTNFHCYANQLTGWMGGSVSNTLGTFRADNNALTQSAVDGLLVAFDEAGRVTSTRVLNLGGGTNSTPSATGKEAADNLRAKGWTVTLNGY